MTIYSLNILPFPVWNQSAVPCSVLTVASWPAYRFLRRQVRRSGIPISWRLFHSLLWSTQCSLNVACGVREAGTVSTHFLVSIRVWSSCCHFQPHLSSHRSVKTLFEQLFGGEVPRSFPFPRSRQLKKFLISSTSMVSSQEQHFNRLMGELQPFGCNEWFLCHPKNLCHQIETTLIQSSQQTWD